MSRVEPKDVENNKKARFIYNLLHTLNLLLREERIAGSEVVVVSFGLDAVYSCIGQLWTWIEAFSSLTITESTDRLE